MKSEPVSWLLLERYALGELGPEERASVEARLAESEVDRACLAQIRDDASELPPLPLPALRAVPASAARTPDKRGRAPSSLARARWVAFSGALCAAAAALFLVLRPHTPNTKHAGSPEPTPTGAALDEGVKGSDVSLHVISDRQGQDPRTFTSGERFKLELTCPPSLGPSLRLFVFQGEQVFEPLPLGTPLACGNRVAWPGAFALDGSDAVDVCVSWSTKLELVTQRSDLGDDATCVRLATP